MEQVNDHVIIFGATGRVGSAAVAIALQRGLEVTAVVRDPSKLAAAHDRLHVITGDTLDADSVRSTIERGASFGASAVLMAVGSDPLRASTVVTQTVTNIASAMSALGRTRYLGISGTAQMKANAVGRVEQAVIRRVIPAARDHQGAFEAITATELDFVLAGCPYIKDGPARHTWVEEPGAFRSGFKTITPSDVAEFLIIELMHHRYSRQIVGIWN